MKTGKLCRTTIVWIIFFIFIILFIFEIVLIYFYVPMQLRLRL